MLHSYRYLGYTFGERWQMISLSSFKVPLQTASHSFGPGHNLFPYHLRRRLAQYFVHFSFHTFRIYSLCIQGHDSARTVVNSTSPVASVNKHRHFCPLSVFSLLQYLKPSRTVNLTTFCENMLRYFVTHESFTHCTSQLDVRKKN